MPACRRLKEQKLTGVAYPSKDGAVQTKRIGSGEARVQDNRLGVGRVGVYSQGEEGEGEEEGKCG